MYPCTHRLAEENFKKDVFIQTGGDTGRQNRIHFNTFLYLGILYYEMMDNEKARENLQKCLAIYQAHPDANYYLGMLYKRELNMELKNKYLEIAKQSKAKGYDINEDNIYYAYYPHQITLYEINKELQ